jgi:ADP-ribose pyrophosphatase
MLMTSKVSRPNSDNGTLVDLPASAEISSPQPIGRGFRSYDRYQIALHGGHTSAAIERDILCSGAVVGVLPIDLVRNEVVLIRQFRLGGHMALGKGGMIELPAGRVDPQETAEQAARRECFEETGAHPERLQQLFQIMPAPALSDECMTVYVASVDATKVEKRSGCTGEGESIETIRIPMEVAVEMLSSGGLHNSVLIIALQWLALNLPDLPRILEEQGASPSA